MGAVKASHEPIHLVDLLVELHIRFDIFNSWQSEVLCGTDFLDCNIKLAAAVPCISFGHLEGVGRHTIVLIGKSNCASKETRSSTCKYLAFL
jgi:hypothetical protein